MIQSWEAKILNVLNQEKVSSKFQRMKSFSDLCSINNLKTMQNGNNSADNEGYANSDDDPWAAGRTSDNTPDGAHEDCLVPSTSPRYSG
jgi:hypothetical protein